MEAAFWLASYPKSGNTWVRMLLTAYHLGVLDINSNFNFTQHDASAIKYKALSPIDLAELSAEQVLYLRHAVLLHLCCTSAFRPNVIKTHCANITVGGVDLIPAPLSAGGIYIVRDPRDVVVSFAKHTGMTNEVAIAHMATPDNRLQNRNSPIASWMSTWSGHVKSWEVPGCIRVKYEDMKENTYAQFTRILAGIKLQLDNDRAKKAVELCELDRLKKQEEEAGTFIELGLQKRFFGDGKGWQNELTEKQVKKIEMDHGEVMEELGYKLEYL